MMVWNVMESVAADMLEPICYLPYGVVFGVLLLIAAEFWQHFHIRKGLSEHSRGLIFLYGVYFMVCAMQTFFSREPGSRTGVDWGLFETVGKSPQARAYFVENILMCIPLGVLHPLGVRRFRKPQYCIAAGMMLSICLEVLQFATQRGHFQLDDIVTNTLGTAMGWGLYYLFYKKWRVM